MNQNNTFEKVSILEVKENENGDTVVICDISDDFKTWFMETEGLKRWSPKRFEKFFNEGLRNGLKASSGSEQKETV